MAMPQNSVRTALALLTSVLAATTVIGALLSAPGREPTGMQVIVSPHPDDEFLVWSAIEDDPSTYTVVVTLTRGEATSRCQRAEDTADVEVGEVLPDGLPAASGSAECAQARLQSWRSFLDAAARDTSEIALGRSADVEHVTLTNQAWGRAADVWVGENAAYVALSLGDGGVTQDGAKEAVQALLDQRGSTLPDLPVRRILAASYWNDSDSDGARTAASGDCSAATDCPGTTEAFEYEHPDHRATSLAMASLAPQTQAGSWISAPSGAEGLSALVGDSRAEVVTGEVEPSVYEAIMGLGPNGDGGEGDRQGEGLQQEFYGWLAFPGDSWAPGERSGGDVLFAREQSFLVIPGGER